MPQLRRLLIGLLLSSRKLRIHIHTIGREIRIVSHRRQTQSIASQIPVLHFAETASGSKTPVVRADGRGRPKDAVGIIHLFDGVQTVVVTAVVSVLEVFFFVGALLFGVRDAVLIAGYKLLEIDVPR